MKSKRRARFLICIIFILVAAAAFSQEKQIEKLVIDLTAQFQSAYPAQDLKPRVGVLETVAPNSGIAALITASITETVSRSSAFILIERGRLEDIIDEQKLALTGLTDTETSVEIGNIQGVEFLLMTSISESGRGYRLSARLVDAETGQVTAAAGVELPGDEVDAQSADYLADAFRSRFGLSVRPSVGIMAAPWDEKFLSVSAIDAFYRIASFASVGLGYGNLVASTPSGYGDPKFIMTIEGEDFDVKRTYAFHGDSLRLTASGNITPTPRLHLGLDATFNVFVNSYIREDLPGFPVYQIIGDPGSISAEKSRIIVDAFTHELYVSYEFAFKADYLLSQRLSLFVKPGYFILPVYSPQGFRSGEVVQDSNGDGEYGESDIDANGTFSEYHSFNFARDKDGDMLTYSSQGFLLSFGVAVHF